MAKERMLNLLKAQLMTSRNIFIIYRKFVNQQNKNIYIYINTNRARIILLYIIFYYYYFNSCCIMHDMSFEIFHS